MSSITQRRAAIYCRGSTPGQEEDGTSLQSQEERCHAYALNHGYAVVGTFIDVHSGAEYRNRKALSRLRQLVRAGGVDVLVSLAIDRLTRDQTHLAVLADECDAHDVRLEFVTEQFDNSAVGEFTRSAKSIVAEVEREKIAARTYDGKQKRVGNGSFLPGCRPRYGYDWSDTAKSALIVHPIHGPIVIRIFDMAAKGTSTRAIAVQLNLEGIPTPSGRATGWRHSVVRGILDDPIYTGKGASFRYETRKVRATRKGKEGKEYYRAFRREDPMLLPEGTVPALVSSATFAAVQQRRQRNRAQAARNNRHPEDALLRAGFAKCGYCGRTLIVSSANHEYRCAANGDAPGTCRERPCISVYKLDREIWRRVTAIMTEPGTVSAQLAALASDDPAAADLVATERALTNLTRQQATLIENLGLVSGETAALVAQKLTTLEVDKQKLQEQRAGILEARADWARARAQVRSLEDWCADVGRNLDLLDYDDRRTALLALNLRVEVWKASHEPPFHKDWGIPRSVIVDSTSTASTSGSKATRSSRA